MARKGEVSILLKIRDGGSAALAATQARLKKFAGELKGYFTSVNGALTTLTAGLTVASIGAYVVRSTMEFQRFSAQLQIFSGSAAKANAVMNDLKRLAIELPFDLAQITESFITLRSAGVNPSEKTFRAIGDIASGMGRDISTLALAVKNGLMGEMEMLKQFGFSLLVDGDKLRASFGTTSKLIGRDAASILGFLEEIAQKEFAGAAAARMQTLEGAFSNLQDKAWNLAVTIGERGGVAEAIAEMAGDMGDLADAIERNETAVVKWTRVLVESLQLLGSLVWASLVVPFDAVVGTVALALQAILQLGAGAMQVMHGLASAMGALVGDNSIIRGLKELTDPTFLQGLANATGGFAQRRFQGGANQIGNVGGRAADWWVALTTSPGMGVGRGGLVGSTMTPNNGRGQTEYTVEDYNKRQLAIAKAQMEREERELRGRAGGATSAAVDLFERRLTRSIGSNVVNNAGLPTAAELKKMNDELTATLDALKLGQVYSLSFGQSLGAAISESTDGLLTMRQQLLQLTTDGIGSFVNGFVGAFAQIREGWDEVGRAMVGAVTGAIAEMAAGQARYYATKAIAAVGEALLNPLGATKSLAAAAKFTAAAAGFAAMAGVAGSAGAGAGAGGGGRGRFSTNAGVDDATGAPLTLVLNGDRFDLNDPRTQDEFRQMLERLAGRAVVIRSR